MRESVSVGTDRVFSNYAFAGLGMLPPFHGQRVKSPCRKGCHSVSPVAALCLATYIRGVRQSV